MPLYQLGELALQVTAHVRRAVIHVQAELKQRETNRIGNIPKQVIQKRAKQILS